MPELPEVTTIINVLKKTTLIGTKIKSVDVLIPKVIKNTTVNKFKQFFVGEEFINIENNQISNLFYILTEHIISRKFN